jgi:hypothetical protein
MKRILGGVFMVFTLELWLLPSTAIAQQPPMANR